MTKKTRTFFFVPLPVSFFVILFLFVLVFLYVLFSLFSFVLRSLAFLPGSPSAPPPPWFLRSKNGQNSIWGKNRTSLNMPRSCSAKPTVQFNPGPSCSSGPDVLNAGAHAQSRGARFSAKPYVQCRAVRLMQGRTFNMQGARHRPTKSLRIPCFRLAFAAQDSSVVLQECMPWS